jgi:putative phosphoesterase
MKIAIISDIHGNLAYLERAKKIIDEEKIENVICCGDIQTEEALLELDSWKQKVFIAWGNADFALQEGIEKGFIEVKHARLFEDVGEIELGKRKIALTHYDLLARKVAATEKFDLVFYGHRHTPWVQTVGKTIVLNPGEIAAQFGHPTFAIFDLETMKADLKILN